MCFFEPNVSKNRDRYLQNLFSIQQVPGRSMAGQRTEGGENFSSNKGGMKSVERRKTESQTCKQELSLGVVAL